MPSHSCMEHAVHLAASKVIESISPTPRAAILKRLRKTIQQARDDNRDPDLEQVDTDLATLERDPDGDGNLDEFDDGEEFGSGDALGKALSLVKQIRRSPQASVFFEKSCREAGIQPLQLLTWVRTRWASLFDFLDRIIKLQQVHTSVA